MAHFMHYVLDALHKYSERPLFKGYAPKDGKPAWFTVTYGTFLVDIESAAAHWLQKLDRELSVPPESIVGLWYVDPIVRC
jgi:hypothetical protein